jgi:multiple antibiotic resistance protein
MDSPLTICSDVKAETASPEKDEHMIKRSNVVAALPLLTLAALLASVVLAQAQSVAPGTHLIHPIDQVFTLLFIMLGPIKVIGPFVKLTGAADDALRRSIALRAFRISSIALVLTATAGQFLLGKWNLSTVALQITGSIILFLVALQMVMAQYKGPPASDSQPLTPTLSMAMTPLAFPTIVTPYGIAVLIIFLVLSPGLDYSLKVMGALALVMVLNLLCMLYARQIFKVIGVTALQILGAVLGVLQIALGMEYLLRAMVILGLPIRL